MSRIHEKRAENRVETDDYHAEHGDARFVSDEWGQLADSITGVDWPWSPEAQEERRKQEEADARQGIDGELSFRSDEWGPLADLLMGALAKKQATKKPVKIASRAQSLQHMIKLAHVDVANLAKAKGETAARGDWQSWNTICQAIDAKLKQIDEWQQELDALLAQEQEAAASAAQAAAEADAALAAAEQAAEHEAKVKRSAGRRKATVGPRKVTAVLHGALEEVFGTAEADAIMAEAGVVTAPASMSIVPIGLPKPPAKKSFFASLRDLHKSGCDFLGGGASVYTDAATVAKVQKALGVDTSGGGRGVLGPKTKAAVIKANADKLSISSDAITDDLLRALKIDLSAPLPSPAVPKPSTALVPAAPGAPTPPAVSTWESVKNAISTPVPGVNLPAYQVALGGLGAIVLGYGVYKVVSGGGPIRVASVRR